MVKLVSQTFVPVAINADRLPDDEAGHFFRGILKKSRWPQGLWIVSTSGEVLAFHYLQSVPNEKPSDTQKRWVNETRDAVQAGVKAAGTLPPRALAVREPFPDRGRGVHPDSSVRLAVFVRFLVKERRDGDPVVDSVQLSAAEWAAFCPPMGGTEWSIPEETMKRFATALGPLTDSIYSPIAENVSVAKVTAKLTGDSVSYTGTLESLHFRDGDPKLPIRVKATLEGVGHYDREKKELTSLRWVLSGTYRNVPPWDKPRAFGSVVEWQK